MGTTRTAFQTYGGVGFQVVIAVEGYAPLLTDGPTAAAVTAWAADTEHTSAIGGLQVMWDWEQRFKPWEPEIDVDGLSFAVMDCDGTDAFGIAVLGSGAGVETYLTEDLPPYANGVTTINVLSTSLFPSSGTIYIGIEAITYTAKTATQFTGCTRGRYAPFKAYTESVQRLGRAHPLPLIGDGQGTIIKPKVTSAPRHWRGRYVGVWIHRIVDGVLDVKAEAQCVWQGRIRDVRDEASGLTVVDCEDVRARIKDTVLMSDQWSARVQEGIYLRAGWKFKANDVLDGAIYTARDLQVTSGSVSGTNQIAAGYYTIDMLADALNAWFLGELNAARLGLVWNWYPRYTDQSTDTLHSRFRWKGSTTNQNTAEFTSPHPDVSDFMGFHGDQFMSHSASHQWTNSSGVSQRVSPETPYRILIGTSTDGLIAVEDVRGTFFDNHPWFPSGVGITPTATGYYTSKFAVLQINGGPMGLFEYAPQPSGIALRFVTHTTYMDNIAGASWFDSPGLYKVRLDDTGERRFAQVAVIYGSLLNVMTRLLASTGAPGYNGTYDVFPAQLGAAIPWDLLGSTWTDSVSALAESHGSGHGAMLLVVEKPTKLSEVIACELIARTSAIVLKDACLKVATWGTPTAALATHTLTVANKSSPTDAQDDQVTVANESDDTVVNVIKLEYNRTLSGGYASTINIRHVASIADLGVERVITISMRNSFSGQTSTSESIEALRDVLVTAIEMFAYPLRRLKRTVDISLFEGLAPGDFGTITDDFARSPATGIRSITTKPHLLLAHHVDYGGFEMDTQTTRPMMAEVEVLILPLDNISSYCPTAMADITVANGGYNVLSKTVTCEAHAHSLSTETADAARFLTGHKVRVIEVDPSDPANPETWTDTVASQTGNTIVLTTGGTWTSTKYHRVVSDSYTTAVTVQKANVYQADDADGMVADTVSCYAYGQAPQQAGSWTAEADAGTELPALYAAAAYGDGVPLTTGDERDVARLCNNAVSYRTAVNLNSMSRTKMTAGTTSFTRQVLAVIRIPAGPGELGLCERYLRVSPFFRSTTALIGPRLFATLTRKPPVGSSWTNTDPNFPTYFVVGTQSPTVAWTASGTTFKSGEPMDISIRCLDPNTGTGYLVIESEPYIEMYGMTQLMLLNVQQP